jgi:hypothetical protein
MALSGIQFSGPILVGLNQPVDVKYGPYATTTAALTEIPLTLRHIGLTVGIDDATDGLKEYWFKAGTADLNLVLKEADASVDLSPYRTSAAQDTIDAGKASTSHTHSELNSPDNIKQIELQNNGNLTLPNGGVISDSAVAEGSLTLTPPNAGAGQGLVIRPTVSTWSITSSGFIVYGSPITISVDQLSNGNYFGTVNYSITGSGVTQASLGRELTGSVVFSGTGPETETITWTIPANSDITEFTLTLTSVDGTRSADPSTQNDPELYYSFEDSNGLPTNQFVTVTNNGITNSEHSHVHLISADPSTVDIYLGDDDQYVKIERDAGGIVIGNNNNTNQWNFKTDGTLELPANGDITISGASVLGGGGGGVQANWDSTSGPSSILNKPTLAAVATSGSYANLSNTPTLGTAAATDSTDYATAAQGTTADSALQASALTLYRTSAAQDIIDTGKATSAQGAKADSASQPGHGHSLTDITASGATTGQVAAWDGTAWAPSTPAAAGVTSVNTRTGAVTLTLADVPNAVGSVTTGIAPATPITNMMQITSVGYGNITPAANTLYIIVG